VVKLQVFGCGTSATTEVAAQSTGGLHDLAAALIQDGSTGVAMNRARRAGGVGEDDDDTAVTVTPCAGALRRASWVLQAAAAGGVEARVEARDEEAVAGDVAGGDVAGGGVEAVTVVVFVSVVVGAGVTGRPAEDALVDMGAAALVLEPAVVLELHALITTTAAAVRVVQTTIRELMKVITSSFGDRRTELEHLPAIRPLPGPSRCNGLGGTGASRGDAGLVDNPAHRYRDVLLPIVSMGGSRYGTALDRRKRSPRRVLQTSCRHEQSCARGHPQEELTVLSEAESSYNDWRGTACAEDSMVVGAGDLYELAGIADERERWSSLASSWTPSAMVPTLNGRSASMPPTAWSWVFQASRIRPEAQLSTEAFPWSTSCCTTRRRTPSSSA